MTRSWTYIAFFVGAHGLAACSSGSTGRASPSTEEPGGGAPTDQGAPAPMVPTDPAAPAAPGDPKPPSAPKLTGCGIDSGFPGDEYCILPPPPGLGFQIHTGPSSYDDPDEVAKYVVDAGQETVEFISATAGNDEDVYFYGRQYRMRPGSHH